MLPNKIGLQVRCGQKWPHCFAASNVKDSPRKHFPEENGSFPLSPRACDALGAAMSWEPRLEMG